MSTPQFQALKLLCYSNTVFLRFLRSTRFSDEPYLELLFLTGLPGNDMKYNIEWIFTCTGNIGRFVRIKVH